MVSWALAAALVLGAWLGPAGLAGLGTVQAATPDEEQFNFAEGLLITKDYRSAAEEYQALVQQHPQSARATTARFRLGDCYLRLEKFPEAAAALEAALKAAPDAPEAPLGNYNLGRALLKLQRLPAAAEAFARAAAKGEGELREEALCGQGECLLQTDKLKDAIAVFDTVLKDFPQTKRRATLLYSLGWALANDQQHARAVTALQQLLKDHPDFAQADKARLLLSDSYAAQKKYDDAGAILQQLVAANREGEEATLRLAWTLLKDGKKEPAARIFREFAAKYPQHASAPLALYNAGITLYDLKQYPAAVETFLKLKETAPQSREAQDLRFWLALSYFELGKHAEAIALLEPLVAGADLEAKLRPGALYTLAEARSATKDYAGAVKSYDELLAKHGDSTYAENAVYARATTLEKLGKLPEAVAGLADFLKRFPKSPLRPHALFAQGEYLYRLDQKEQALVPLQELAQDPKASDKAIYRLAWTQYDLKQYVPARANFGKLAGRAGEFQAESRYLSGLSAEALDQAPAAIADFAALTAPGATGEYTEKAFVRLGFLYPQDKALANLAAYQQRFPKGEQAPVLQLRIAENYFGAGAADQALAVYQELARGPLPPARASAVAYGTGWCLVKLGKDGDADAQFAKVSAKDAPPAMAQDAQLQRAEIAYRKGDHAAAAALFTQLAALDSSLAERAAYMAGWCARHLKQNDEAIARFRAQLKRFPAGDYAADGALRLSEALADKQDFAEARKVLEAARARVPPKLDEEFLHRYADTLVSLADWEAVIALSKEMQEKFKESKLGYQVSFRLGLAYKAAGLLDQAETAFKDTIAATNAIQAAEAQFNIGSLYYARKDYLAAAKNYLRVDLLYDAGELRAKALYHAVDAFMQTGEEGPRRAELYVTKLKEKYPDSPWTAKAVKRHKGEKLE